MSHSSKNQNVNFSGFLIAHAPSIININNGLILVFHGCRTVNSRKNRAVNSIWLSYYTELGWSAPVELVQDENSHCWNPVLYMHSSTEVWLFYKVGERPATWSGKLKISKDGGLSWSKEHDMPKGYIGPTKNAPLSIENDVLLVGSSRETSNSQSICIERLNLNSAQKSKLLLGSKLSNKGIGVIQPSFVQSPNGKIFAFCRSNNKSIYVTHSIDKGDSWSQLLATNLPNPNSAIATCYDEKGFYLAFNPSSSQSNRKCLRINYYEWHENDDFLRAETISEIEINGHAVAYPTLCVDKNHLVVAFSIGQKSIMVKQFLLNNHAVNE